MANELFYYEVEHFYKNGGRHGQSQCNFPKMRRVESISQMVEQLKTDSDW